MTSSNQAEGGAIPPTSLCTNGAYVTTSYNKLQQVTMKNKEELRMRKPTVERKVTTLNITALGMDVVSGEPMTKTYPVYKSEAPKDEVKLFNYLRKMYETESFKISAITSKDVVTKTYSMPLAKYIEEADVVEDKLDNSNTESTAQ